MTPSTAADCLRGAPKLADYLAGMRSASTADELERAIQVPFKHAYRGSVWSRISKVRIEEGERICGLHPRGDFVPRLGPRHRLTVCGETYRVGYGQNSTGVRYCWYYAQQWVEGILKANGLSMRAAHSVWDSSLSYPHRALRTIDMAFTGKLPDPRFNRLIPHKTHDYSRPVRVTERNAEATDRAHRPCKCGGWLWDWGCGWNGYALFINWHCDECPRVYTEYITNERLMEIRRRPSTAIPTKVMAKAAGAIQ